MAETPNRNTLSVYEKPFGVATGIIFRRGSGNFSRTAPTPAFVKKVNIRESDTSGYVGMRAVVIAVAKLETRIKYLYICDREAVDRWFEAHPRSALYGEWVEARKKCGDQMNLVNSAFSLFRKHMGV